MHEKTFVGQSATLAQIHKNFYQQIEESVDKNQEEAATAETVADDNDILRTVIATLKALLANEFQMQESDVDEDVEFVELGLDSISGVTWVRKINEKYHTSIEATKV